MQKISSNVPVILGISAVLLKSEAVEVRTPCRWQFISYKGFKMRKRIIARPLHTPPPEQGWLDLGCIASVEVTSEDNAFPIESALLQQEKGGWRAAEPGVQT